MTTRAQPTDFTLYAEKMSSVCLLTPVTDDAQAWMDECLPEDAMWLSGGMAIESRYIGNILEGINGDGLTVSLL